jgi:hypothetical protein
MTDALPILLADAEHAARLGDRDRARSALDGAAALVADRDPADPDRIEVQLRAAEVHARLQDLAAARAAIASLPTTDPTVAARIALVLARTHYVARELDAAETHAWRALRRLPPDADRLRAVARQLAGAVATRRGEYGRAAALLSQTAAFARAHGDLELLTASLVELGYAHFRRSDWPPAGRAFTEAAEVAAGRMTRSHRIALEGWFFASIELGDLARADDLLARIGALGETPRALPMMEAQRWWWRGDLTRARTSASAAPDRLGLDELLCVAIEAGDPVEAEALLAERRARDAAPTGPTPPWMPLAVAALRGDRGAWWEAARAFGRTSGGTAARICALAADAWLRHGAPSLAARSLALGLGAARAASHPLGDALAARLDAMAGAVPVPLGEWDLTTLLGRGGFGEVQRGERPDGAVAAVKVLRADLAASARRRERFAAEIRTMTDLRHPAIVPVFGAGVVDEAAERLSGGAYSAGSPWLAMELAEGTLEPWCGRLSFGEARAVLLRLLGGLAHAHARGVWHRDLKPANVLVGASPAATARITDFGLAITVEARAVGDGGTWAYMPPEQRERRWRELGPWTDLYALGCVAVELLAGRPGEPGARPPPAVPVPPGYGAWLARLLDDDPQRRFAHAADAAAALASLPEATETAPRPDPSSRPTVDTWVPHEDEPGPPLPALSSTAPEPAARPRGRDGVLRLLDAALADAAAGRAAVVQLRGAPGVGTSTVARWFATSAAEDGRAVALSPLRRREGMRARPPDLLRSALRADGLAGEALAEHLRRTLGSVDLDLAWAAAVLDTASPAGEVTAADRVAWTLLRDAARGRPWLVVLDDPDDPVGPTADAAAVAALGDGPALVVLVTDDAAPVAPGARAVTLGPLAEDDVVAWLREDLGLEARSARRLAERAEGNPGLLRAWVDVLRARQQLRPGPDGEVLRLAPDDELPVGADAEAPLARRTLEGLPPDAARSLELAALGGPRLDRAVWEAACALDGCEVPPALLERWEADGTLVAGQDQVAFERPALRRHLADRAARSGRDQALHGVLARAWEGRGDEAARGRHLLLAGEPEQAVAVLVAAARAADLDPHTLLRVTEALAEAGGAMPPDLAVARVEALVEAGAAALTERGEAGTDPELRSRLAVARGRASIAAGRYSEAVEQLEAARTETGAVSAARATTVLYNLGVARWYAGDHAGAEQVLLDGCARHPDHADLLRVELADQYVQAGELAEAAALLARFSGALPADRAPTAVELRAWTGLGRLRWAEGRLAEAEAVFRRTSPREPPDVTALRGVNLALLAQQQGRGVLAGLREWRARVRLLGWPVVDGILACAVCAELAADPDEAAWAAALAEADRALPHALDADAVRCLGLGADRAADAGLPARADALRARAAELAARLGG